MDNLSPARRSENMRRIRGKDTSPELAVRRIVRELGFSGYRLHRKDLPGKPDIAWIGKKKAVFVHGCFWHGHNCKEGVRKPKSRKQYWLPKIEKNQYRDEEHANKLKAQGWKILVVWECELRDSKLVKKRLKRFLS